MHRTRRTRLGQAFGGLALSVLLLAGCSDDAPAPSPAAPAPSASTTSSAEPSASPTSASAEPTASTEPSSAPSSSPTAGGDGSVEPSRPVQTAAPKKLDEPARTAGAKVSLLSVRSTTIKASTPGDSSGPGVLVRLEIDNTTAKALDTSFVQVNVTNASGAPGTAVVGSPTKAIAGSVRSGATAQATYAFLLDGATSGDVTVLVYVTSGQPVAQFRGRVS